MGVFMSRFQMLRTAAQLRVLPISIGLIAAVVLGGCAIRPVQEDVTRVSTKEIVRRVRCEARVAVLDKAIQLLREYDDPTGRAAAIANGLEAQRGQPLKFNPLLLHDNELRGFYNRYINTGIAYEFNFDITEKNEAAAAADPVKLITNGTVGIGVDGSSKLSRQNIRRFVISDNFGDLLTSPELTCEPTEYRADNPIYPITGTVGLGELIHTFIDLNESRTLQPLDASKAASRFGDTLIFSTTFDASVTPHIQLNAVRNRWGLAPPTNVSFSASRADVHKLIVGVSMNAEGKLPLFGGQRIEPPLAPPSPPAVRRSSRQRPAALLNEQNARDIVNEQRYKDFLDKGAIIVPR